MTRSLAFVLAVAAWALALAAGPAAAQQPSVLAARLAANPCANVTLKTDFAANSGSGVYCLKGAHYGRFLDIPGASFTRASNETCEWLSGRLTYAASGVPCITDKGFAGWAAATNVALRSQLFANSPWTPVDTTRVDNQTTAPDGTLTAANMFEGTAVNTQHRVDQSFTFSAVPYTFSVYAKPNGRSWIMLRIDTSGAFFDLQNGVVGASPGVGVTATITKAANGFWRCAITYTPAAATSAIRINLGNIDNGLNYTGDGMSGVFLWGAQLEQAGFASSYIPTTSASVTRAADVASINAFAEPTAATVYSEWATTQLLSLQTAVWSTSTPYMHLQIDNTGRAVARAMDGSFVVVSAISSGTESLTGINKNAYAYQNNDYATSLNGAAVATGVGTPLPTGATSLLIGNWFTGGGSQLNGYVRNITIYPSRLSNTQVQALTR